MPREEGNLLDLSCSLPGAGQRPSIGKRASSSSIPKTSYHARSISLPSRPHPLIPQIDEHLCGLRTSEATSSSSSMTQKLRSLENLYEYASVATLSAILGPKEKPEMG